METTLDEVLSLLGAKEVQIYSLTKRVNELEAELASTNDKKDTDKE